MVSHISNVKQWTVIHAGMEDKIEDYQVEEFISNLLVKPISFE